MPVVPIADARERLASGIETVPSDDLDAYFREFFPTCPLPEDGAASGQLADHIRRVIERDEVANLWRVVFPGTRAMYYDEELGTLHYREQRLR